jgi:hypothetical protein
MAPSARAAGLALAAVLLHVFLSPLPGVDAAAAGMTSSGCPCVGLCERTVDSPFRPWCYTSNAGAAAPRTVDPNNPNNPGSTSSSFPTSGSSTSSSSTTSSSSSTSSSTTSSTGSTSGSSTSGSTTSGSSSGQTITVTPINPDTGLPYCGRFSVSRLRYWDECTLVNTTGSTPVITLTTFESMWTYMTISTVGFTVLVYGTLGCAAAALTSARRSTAFLWLPAAAACVGGCQAFVVGAIFASIVSFMYLSMPYAIDDRVAVSMGLGLGLILVYASLGRGQAGPKVRGGGGDTTGARGALAGPPHASEYLE